MAIEGTARRRWRLRHVAAAGVVLVSGFGFATYSRQPARVDDQRADCQHTWKGYRQPGNSALPIARVALAEFTSDIPEFHDCQKLIAKDGKSYLPEPTAIFAHQALSDQWETLTPVSSAGGITNQGPGNQAQVTGSIANAVAIVEILNYGPDYAPLGIKTGFNCLFVARAAPPSSDKYKAVMVPVGTDESCTTRARFDTLSTNVNNKTLMVRETVTGLSPDSYPPVARWDWDKTQNKHVIGVMCPNAWCEIGEGKFTTGASYSGDRVHRVKGWYDEQRLAVTAGDSLVPSTILGTVFPDPMLSTFSESQFRGTWVRVASVAMSQESDEYKTKLNLEPSSPYRTGNLVSLCAGMTKADCAPTVKTPLSGIGASLLATWRLPTCDPGAHVGATKTTMWWAKIRSAKTGTEVYRCVHRWAVPTGVVERGFKVPGTARWRWLLNDETIWQACIQGCCEVRES